MSNPEFVFPFSQRLRDEFIAQDSTLIHRWAEKYSILFDEKDVETAKNQAPLKDSGWGGYHFYEWLAAILVYEATGMHSLVESYQFANNPKKQAVLQKLLTDTQRALVANRDGSFKAQAPDLLVYAPDHSSYFFCEVKGPGDKVNPVDARFSKALEDACQKPVILARFVRCDTLRV